MYAFSNCCFIVIYVSTRTASTTTTSSGSSSARLTGSYPAQIIHNHTLMLCVVVCLTSEKYGSSVWWRPSLQSVLHWFSEELRSFWARHFTALYGAVTFLFNIICFRQHCASYSVHPPVSVIISNNRRLTMSGKSEIWNCSAICELLHKSLWIDWKSWNCQANVAVVDFIFMAASVFNNITAA